MMSETPLVSFVIPAYNAGRYLRDCIESLRAQTFGNWEAVIVDDCSDDDTLSIALRMAVKESRIRVVRMPRPSGRAFEPRKVAVMAARGEWISKLDADDLLPPDALERMLALIERSKADILYPTVFRLEEEGKTVRHLPKTDGYYHREIRGRSLLRDTLDGWKFAASGGLTRKSLYERIYARHSYPPGNAMIDEVCSRHILAADPVAIFSEAPYLYRRNPESLSTRRSVSVFDYIKVAIELIDLTESEFGKDSAEYILAQRQNFHTIFNMYKLLNHSDFSRKETAIAETLLCGAKQRIDWKALKGHVSPRYSLILKWHLPERLMLRLFRK
ncbi:MAG: glycosyltransferase family 2 protein [Bacteroidales bacterium]|nr:glycosyltransferase family 2 protein [Bacteroidales bacterium]